MVTHYFGWFDFVLLQDLLWPTAPNQITMTKKPFLSQLIYGGFLALSLSYLIANYYSSSLLNFYHDWTGWRRITGHAPNKFTGALNQISWSLVFCMSWWMLWRLDRFIISPNPAPPDPSHSQTQKTSTPPPKEEASFQGEKAKSENFEPEEEVAWSGNEDNKESTHHQEEESVNEPFLNSEDSDTKMAKVLGLDKDQLADFTEIKQTYRRAIAQYHPDKVSALGSEIQDVAEKKAKEINQAYEFFHNKFKNL